MSKDLLLVFFVDTHTLPRSKSQEVIKETAQNLRAGLSDDKVSIMVIPSDRNDLKVVPIKCYLEGKVPDQPDNIQELIEKLQDFQESIMDSRRSLDEKESNIKL